MFTGRIGIGQYWKAIITLLLLQLGVSLVFGLILLLTLPSLLKSASSGGGIFGAIAIGFGGVVLAFLIPALIALPYTLGLIIRRYHDIGISGWIWVLVLIPGFLISHFLPLYTVANDPSTLSIAGIVAPLVYAAICLIILLWPGTPGANRYGESTHYTSVWAAIKAKKPEQITPNVPLYTPPTPPSPIPTAYQPTYTPPTPAPYTPPVPPTL